MRVTPRPYTPGGPPLLYGGGTPAAARRAARFGLPFLAQVSAPELEQVYRDECARHGVEAGMCIIPAAGSATSLFVAEDVDEGWARYGPHMLHDARMYASWLGGTAAASKSVAPTVDALPRRVRRVPRRDADRSRRLRPSVRTAPPPSPLRRVPSGRRVGVTPPRVWTCSPRCADGRAGRAGRCVP